MSRILAVDGNSLAHRAFHSTREESARDDTGPASAEVTGAFFSMLASTWRYGPYTTVIVGFDDADNLRKRDYPEYKANRPPSDPALHASLEALRTHLDEAGLPPVVEPGAEADDVVAAVVDACQDRCWPCDVLSSDRDLIALVDDDVRLLRPRARFTDLLVEDRARVVERYGIEPHQYPDLAALRGDPSDGLDGIDGIGTKTAARLLRSHGSVVGIYDALDTLTPRLESALRSGRDRVESNLLLMAPLPHVTVDPTRFGFDLDTVCAMLERIGQRRAARRLRRAVTDPVPPVPDTPPEPPDEPPVEEPPGARSARSAREQHPRTRIPQSTPERGDQQPLF